MKKPENLIFPVGLVFYSAFLFYSTFSMRTLALTSVGPAVVPRLLAGGLGLLSLLLVALELRRRFRYPRTKEAERPETAAEESNRHATVKTMALLILYVAAFDRLGFIVSTTLYLFLQIVLIRGRAPAGRLALWACLSAAVALAIYLIFVKLIAMPLPEGWLSI